MAWSRVRGRSAAQVRNWIMIRLGELGHRGLLVGIITWNDSDSAPPVRRVHSA